LQLSIIVIIILFFLALFYSRAYSPLAASMGATIEEIEVHVGELSATIEKREEKKNDNNNNGELQFDYSFDLINFVKTLKVC